MTLHSVLATEFSEHPVANPALSELHQFDVPFVHSETIHAGEFGPAEYCKALMIKLFSLTHLQVGRFLEYQCRLLNEPRQWLMTLEDLLEKNLHLFTTWHMRMKTEVILIQTTFLFQEIENGRFPRSKKYDITTVKMKLRNLKSFVEQLNYLYELKTEYLQDKFKIIDCSETPFDQLLAIEIEKVEQMRISIERVRPQKKVLKNNLSEHYIDNNEFIIKMNISKRTAQLWRDQGLINFIQIGAKIYYKITDVELMLQQNYVKPFKKK